MYVPGVLTAGRFEGRRHYMHRWQLGHRQSSDAPPLQNPQIACVLVLSNPQFRLRLQSSPPSFPLLDHSLQLKKCARHRCLFSHKFTKTEKYYEQQLRRDIPIISTATCDLPVFLLHLSPTGIIKQLWACPVKICRSLELRYSNLHRKSRDIGNAEAEGIIRRPQLPVVRLIEIK